MSDYMVTFGQKYHRETHPVLGDFPQLPDHYGVVCAPDEWEARQMVLSVLGQAWSGLYPLSGTDTAYYPAGRAFTIAYDDGDVLRLSR